MNKGSDETFLADQPVYSYHEISVGCSMINPVSLPSFQLLQIFVVQLPSIFGLPLRSCLFSFTLSPQPLEPN